jgi:DNA (cytosine-5)-methyltransferase 1
MLAPNQVRTFDLFCGGGGSSLGAKQAGATIIGGIDNWSVATDAFAINFPGTVTYSGDLRTIKPRKIAKEIGHIDLLLASPECTHHSVAKGNRPRREDSKELAFQVPRFAKALCPRWIVVENVIQMRSWASFPMWLSALRQLGYTATCVTLDAANFGVPQTRRRLFVICDRNRVPIKPRTYRRKNLTVAWVLKNAPTGGWSYDFTSLDNGRRSPNTLSRARRAIDAIGHDKEFIMVYYGSDGSGGFQSLDRPLRTVTTIDRFALVRPNCMGHEMRMLQPSELAVAMGFPPSYRFPAIATRRDCIKLLGNAVCPPVMRAVVRSALKTERG